MKKIILGILGLFVGSLLLVSCSSEEDVLSSFSKRKYLKNFKENKKSYEVNLEEQTAKVEEIKSQEVMSETTSLTSSIIEENNVTLNQETIDLATVSTPKKVVKQIKKEYRNWDKFNRNYSAELLASSKEYNQLISKNSSSKVDDIVLVILGIFIPPLAVYLYEDAITANFWVDLLLIFLFWFPSIIFAFLVMFAGVSV
ncbi:MAG: hypothetical protein A3K10_17985 [Bacteroidetes bacterium RIFCSPLOWO2_12_FULL_31_6]|nr:MAG: hypothetical protein A3K10_17985 [Bacteroidetes bacterium RIFCSPLOWO2_12_FULL_31_6]